MRYFLLIIVSIIAVGNAEMVAQSQPITLDAVYFALKMQSGIVLDSAKARSFDSNLALAKRKLGLNPTVNYHVTSRDSFNIVQVEFSSTNTVFVNSWQEGKISTGNKKLDSLSSAVGLVTVTPLPLYTRKLFNLTIYTVELRFRSPINDIKLAQAFRDNELEISLIKGGDLGNCCRVSSSSWINYFECQNIHHFIFFRGSGDCPAGCINSSFYYATVQQADTGKVVNSEPRYGWGDNFAPPYDRPYPHTIPYNFPDIGYSVTQFGSADVLIQSLRHPTWWVQNHAIQGIWRVFTSSTPISLDGYWIDSARQAQWSYIRRGVLSRSAEVISTLQTLRGTGICGVSASIDTALKKILTVGIKEEKQTTEAANIRVSPNPFSDVVRISYFVPSYSAINISIVNTLGIKVASLFNDQHKGQLEIEWRTDDMPSGVYFLQIHTNAQSFVSQRIVLMR
jgi:hypothetical protein